MANVQAQTKGSVKSDLGAGHYMYTLATFYDDGKLSATTITESVTWFGGYTGAVDILLIDNADQIIATTTQKHAFGVDGRWIGRSRRTDSWVEYFDPALAARASKLAVIHYWAPKVDYVRMTMQIGQYLWQLYQQLSQDNLVDVQA